MRDIQDLEQQLRRIDGRGYKSYRDIAGDFEFRGGRLCIDYVQGDPFASPSKLRLRLSSEVAGIPSEVCDSKIRRIAVSDFLARRVKDKIEETERRGGSGKSGLVFIDAGGQEVLERSAVVITAGWVEARIEVGLPAAGRRILGHRAVDILCRDLPELAREGLVWTDEVDTEARNWAYCVENQEAIRAELGKRELVAFVGDGAILPRRSGVSEQPLHIREAVRFASPESLRVEFQLPNPVDSFWGSGRRVSGMGIGKGVSLIAGGGYHGKSTLLRALERCVYPHIPGDGREYVVTDPHAVKIRAEDRRRIEKVDISPFIRDLPSGQSTEAFSTEEASGSTSQAAAIVEAVEAGAQTLLIDEDTSATNFMVRDARMQALVKRSQEPITPLVDRVQQLYAKHGVSTVLVMGGSGDYFDCADTVIVMRKYCPLDTTIAVKEIASNFPTQRESEALGDFPDITERSPESKSIDPTRKKGRVKIDCPALHTIRFGYENIDMQAVEQLVERSQTRAVGYAIHLMSRRLMNNQVSLCEALDALEELLDQDGLDVLNPYYRYSEDGSEHPGNFSRPRRHEVAAALNRLRSLRVFSRKSI